MKAQTSTEFLIISTFIFLAIVVMLPLLSNMLFDVMQEDQKALLKQNADHMKLKIDTAMFVNDGYYENFNLTPTIEGKEYMITNYGDKKLGFSYNDDDYVYLISLPEKSNVSWPTGNPITDFNLQITNLGRGVQITQIA